MAEHAVIVHLSVADDSTELSGFFDLEDRLIAAIEKAKAGEFDGNEVGGGEQVLYMYGPDAERLFAAVRPVLASLPPPAGSYAVLRWGAADDPKAREERRPLT